MRDICIEMISTARTRMIFLGKVSKIVDETDFCSIRRSSVYGVLRSTQVIQEYEKSGFTSSVQVERRHWMERSILDCLTKEN